MWSIFLLAFLSNSINYSAQIFPPTIRNSSVDLAVSNYSENRGPSNSAMSILGRFDRILAPLIIALYSHSSNLQFKLSPMAALLALQLSETRAAPLLPQNQNLHHDLFNIDYSGAEEERSERTKTQIEAAAELKSFIDHARRRSTEIGRGNVMRHYSEAPGNFEEDGSTAGIVSDNEWLKFQGDLEKLSNQVMQNTDNLDQILSMLEELKDQIVAVELFSVYNIENVFK